MSPEMSEVVDRMYEVLLEEIRTHRPELLSEGFTVAEIYQNLVPYRSHRDRIGIEMNGDYEHALLRLLAGEGGYVELESDAARERLQEEIESLHPDTGVYRNFAACEVRLKDERVRSPAGDEEKPDVEEAAPGDTAEIDGAAPREREMPSSFNGSGGSRAADEPLSEARGDGEGEPERPDVEDRGTKDAAPSSSPTAPAALAEDGGDDEPREEADPDATCQWCRERLPEREDLQFCPFCGSGVDQVPCPECGTELEESWLFCVACGTQVQD